MKTGKSKKLDTEIADKRKKEEEEISELAEIGFRMVAVWNTCNDSICCPVCAPLNQRKEDDVGSRTWTLPTGKVGAPPVHDGCRCWLAYEIA